MKQHVSHCWNKQDREYVSDFANLGCNLKHTLNFLDEEFICQTNP